MIKAEHENVTIIGSDEEMINDIVHVNSCFIRLLRARAIKRNVLRKSWSTWLQRDSMKMEK